MVSNYNGYDICAYKQFLTSSWISHKKQLETNIAILSRNLRRSLDNSQNTTGSFRYLHTVVPLGSKSAYCRSTGLNNRNLYFFAFIVKKTEPFLTDMVTEYKPRCLYRNKKR